MTQKNAKTGKKASTTPPERLAKTGNAGKAVGRAELGKLNTTTLYSLLQLKNIPGRSKIRKKGARVKALLGLVTPADLETVGARLPGTSPPPTLSSGRGNAPLEPRWVRGQRLDGPVLGIDVDTKTLVCVVATPAGVEAPFVVPNDPGGCDDLVTFCQYRGIAHVAMESTSEYWLPALWALRGAGIHVLVANPKQTKATQGRKTDKHDARRIALAFRDGRLKPSVLCTQVQYARRKLSRDAIKKAQQGTKATQRLAATYHGVGAPKWVKKLHESARGRRVLRRGLDRDENASLLEVLTEEYARGPHQVTDPVALREMAGELGEVLDRMSPTTRLRVVLHLEEFVSCKRAVAGLRLELLQDAETDPRFQRMLELLVTIPGVGVDLALVIAVELVDVAYFTDAKALVRWVGLNPRVYQSGHRKRSTGKISKAGNKYLRWALWGAVRTDYAHAGKGGHPFGAFARRLKNERGKPYKLAVTAGARKLLTVVYHVLAQDKPFEVIFADMECARIAANRERKLRELETRMRRAPLADLLPRFVKTLENSCEALDAATAEFAAKAEVLLGTARLTWVT